MELHCQKLLWVDRNIVLKYLKQSMARKSRRVKSIFSWNCQLQWRWNQTDWHFDIPQKQKSIFQNVIFHEYVFGVADCQRN